MNNELTNNQTIYSIDYKIEQLQKEKDELKKVAIDSVIDETTAFILEENKKEPLTQRELRNMLKAFYYDLRNVMEK